LEGGRRVKNGKKGTKKGRRKQTGVTLNRTKGWAFLIAQGHIKRGRDTLEKRLKGEIASKKGGPAEKGGHWPGRKQIGNVRPNLEGDEEGTKIQ